MEISEWFQQQLQMSADGFIWAVEQIPQERYYRAPRPNRWSVARIVFHLVLYEQRIALPTMRQWLGAPPPIVGTQEEDATTEEAEWNEGHEVQVMIADFREVRSQQLALLPRFDEHDWNEVRPAIWGPVSLKWVTTKTYQHTLEHTDEILRMYLWWRE